jgi:large subunit ribosomal protein L30
MNYLAAVLVRGTRGARVPILDALDSLRLRNKHVCVVLLETKGGRGAMLRCKDYIAYGTITEETKRLLEEKRGQKTAGGKLKPFFRLAPPHGGYERKGMKKTFAEGGVLGDRGAKMDDLIRRMI